MTGNTLVSAISRHVFGHVCYTARHGLHKGMRVEGGLGWIPSSKASLEHQYLHALDLESKVIFDVGAFVGYVSLFFASRAAYVVAYEPNPFNRRKLERNLSLNRLCPTQVRDVALGDAPGSLQMAWSPARAGEGSLVLASGQEHCTVRVTTLDSEMEEGLPAPDFLKVDVEGAETLVLQGAKNLISRRHPQWFIELHGSTFEDKMQRARAVIGTLLSAGYSIRDVEAERRIEDLSFHRVPSHIHAS